MKMTVRNKFILWLVAVLLGTFGIRCVLAASGEISLIGGFLCFLFGNLVSIVYFSDTAD